MRFKKCNVYLFKNCDYPYIEKNISQSSNLLETIFETKSRFDIDYNRYDTYILLPLSENNKDLIIVAPFLYWRILKFLKPTNVEVIKNQFIENQPIKDFDNNILSYIYRCLNGLMSTKDIKNSLFKTEYFVQSAISKPKLLDKTYNFLLTNNEIIDFRYLFRYYPESFLSKQNNNDLIITTNNKSFLKKCISKFSPTKVIILNRIQYFNINTIFKKSSMF